MNVPRNNAGNVRKNPKFTWQGEQPGAAANDIITFDTVTHSYRAMIKILQAKIKRGLNTLSAIISDYAPASAGNDVPAYIDDVSQRSGIDPSTTLDATDVDTLANIAYYMSWHEQGYSSDDGTLTAALTAAKNIINGIVDKVTTAARENPVVTAIVIAAGLWLLFKEKK